MRGKKEEEDPLSREVIGAAIEVARNVGPGLLEKAYQECLAYEMSKRGLRFEREKPMPVCYKKVKLDCGYKLDFLVEGQLVVEAKAVDQLNEVNEAQLLSYLKLGGFKVGLLINFHAPILKNGIKRMVLGY